MFKKLLGKDWKSSDAHLLLLSKFKSPRSSDDFRNQAEWKSVLHEDISKSINKFISDGYLVEAGLSGKLDYFYKAGQLKDFLKQRDLKVSGNKSELIERLIKSDTTGIQKLVGNKKIYILNEPGLQLANDYIAKQKDEVKQLQLSVFNLLNNRKFKDASKLRAENEARQVFPIGIGIDWKNYDTKRDEIILKYIFSKTPKILDGTEKGVLESLRLIAGMLTFWSYAEVEEIILDNIQTGTKYDGFSSAQMIWNHSLYLYEIDDLEKFAKEGIRMKVEIHNCNDDIVCSECRKLEKKKFKLGQQPEMPYAKCTSPNGCRCSISGTLN